MVRIGLREILLLLFLVLAESYWSETREYFQKAIDSQENVDEQNWYLRNYKKSTKIFRVINFGILLILISIMLSLFSQWLEAEILDKASWGLTLFTSLCLGVFLLFMSYEKYSVNYPRSNNSTTKIREYIRTQVLGGKRSQENENNLETIPDDIRVLEREHRLLKDVLDEQRDTIHSLGDNATKMLRTVLLLVGGIITAILSFEGLQPELFYTRYCLTTASILSIFVSSFFLVSGSLGVGSALRQIYRTEYIDLAFENEWSNKEHLKERVSTQRKQVTENSKTINGNREIMKAADAMLSILFGLLTLLVIDIVFTTNPSLSHPQLAVIIVALVIYATVIVIMYGLDQYFPISHPARVFVDDSKWVFSIIVLGLLIVFLPNCEELIQISPL